MLPPAASDTRVPGTKLVGVARRDLLILADVPCEAVLLETDFHTVRYLDHSDVSSRDKTGHRDSAGGRGEVHRNSSYTSFMGSVTEAWVRIEDWLQRHAPATAALLAPPAAATAIGAAEDRLEITFPPGLVESLRRHDGVTQRVRVLPEASPLSVAGIVDQYDERMDIAEDVDGFTPAGPDGESWWNEHWLPFAASDGGLQIIDLRPGTGQARIGWAPHDNPADFSDGWPSLAAYLTDVADALDDGRAVGARHPYLTIRDELWWSMTAATELNGEPLRPAPPL